MKFNKRMQSKKKWKLEPKDVQSSIQIVTANKTTASFLQARVGEWVGFNVPINKL